MGVAVWAAVIVGPLAGLYIPAALTAGEPAGGGPAGSTVLRSFALAGGIAFLSVVLGYVPGRLLGTAGRHRPLLFGLLLTPLLLPRYVLYYAWSLPVSPTTVLGRAMATNPPLARAVGTTTASMVMLLWYWPLAALLIGQGWRNLDDETWRSARLDAGPGRRMLSVALPLLRWPLAMALGVCFVLALSEFGTFHLAGVNTMGTELAVLYQQSFSVHQVARAAWPMAAAAVAMAVLLWRRMRQESTRPPVAPIRSAGDGWRWAAVAMLVASAVGVPVALLIANVDDTRQLRYFWAGHWDGLAWSGLASAVGAVAALLMASAALLVEAGGRAGRWLGGLMHATILLALLLPGSLVAAAIVELAAAMSLPEAIRQGWPMVSAGLAARWTGISLLVLRLARDWRDRHLASMAAADGASKFDAWRLVHLPRNWPLPAAALGLVAMLGLTEVPATMVLLPAGVPNFAQRLLNQMHYARDQQVIASCLMLVGVYAVVAAALAALLWRARSRAAVTMIALCAIAAGLIGCGASSQPSRPKVVGVFGRTGRGQGEFIYPRAIDRGADGTLFVVDKTGRIQHLTAAGEWIGGFRMPLIAAGKPTGLTVGADGNIYVADTHYHRVVVFGPDGAFVRVIGGFGEEEGQFIFPTDVAIADDGRIYVGEYGGNDRISVFSGDGRFLFSFGRLGSGSDGLSRPAALCIDRGRRRLYVADACNHRIVVYDLEGRRTSEFGSVGRGPGQLRYPYDLALLDDGTLVVCEFGNNRLQLFSPQGVSLGTLGEGGRHLGRLAYPWGVTVDARRRAYVVDAGNNRVQVWQL